jgi:hypothetical protein
MVDALHAQPAFINQCFACDGFHNVFGYAVRRYYSLSNVLNIEVLIFCYIWQDLSRKHVYIIKSDHDENTFPSLLFVWRIAFIRAKL